ncbi:SDR family NAD(P)-dependent oxidoreductase [Actinomycetes bacterium M1A6_2h]
MSDDLAPLSAVVTGATRGIGLGIAHSLAKQGFSLTVTARDEAALRDLKATLRDAGASSVVSIAVDLAADNAADAIASAHHDRYGGSMTALILNAGVGTAGSIVDYPTKRIRKTIDVNFMAPFAILQRSIPMLRLGAQHRSEFGAKVVALSSMAGVYSEAGLAVYGATKAAMLSLIDTLNAEESVNGVSGTSIAPGYVHTDMSAWTLDRIPAEKMIRIEDIVVLVEAVLRLSANAVVPRMVVSRAGSGLQA